jgi:predicted transcriptional regulator
MESENTYQLSTEVCFSAGVDGVAILNVRTGKLYSLIGSASELWRFIAKEKSVTVEELIVQTSKTKVITQQSIETFLRDLLASGLITQTRTQSHPIHTFRVRVCLLLADVSRRLFGNSVLGRSPGLVAFFLITLFYIVSRLGGFQSRALIVKQWPTSKRQTGAEEVPHLCVALATACSWYPKESLCLQRASALSCLLRQHGISAVMRIGIRKQPFYAHAWVEVGGEVVGDHVGVQKYFESVVSW